MLELEELYSFYIGRYGPVILLVVATFLAAERLISLLLQKRRRTGQINERLRLRGKTDSGREAFVTLLRKRGITEAGQYELPVAALNKLFTQSAVRIPPTRLLSLMALGTAGVGVLSYLAKHDALLAVALAVLGGIALPILFLLILRVRRLKAFETQLPEAIDIMIRSIKAGHPLPVAIKMVAREMPDPIGTEFGLTEDEMTYGLDLEEAMGNMSTRVGQDDLAFLVVAISIQSKSGGNLAQILSNLSRMVRERAKMRRKIHSLSAEGRFSAIALGIIPGALYVIISSINQSYYQDVSHDPMFVSSVYIGIALWVMGVFSLYRMVNFKI